MFILCQFSIYLTCLQAASPASLSEYSEITNSLLILIYFCAFITSIYKILICGTCQALFYCKVCSQIIIYVPKNTDIMKQNPQTVLKYSIKHKTSKKYCTYPKTTLVSASWHLGVKKSLSSTVRGTVRVKKCLSTVGSLYIIRKKISCIFLQNRYNWC